MGLSAFFFIEDLIQGPFHVDILPIFTDNSVFFGAVFIMIILYSVVMALIHYKRVKPNTLKGLTLILIILMIIFLPVNSFDFPFLRI